MGTTRHRLQHNTTSTSTPAPPNMSRYEENEPYGWRNRETDRIEGRTRGRLGKFTREEYEGGGGEEKLHVVCVDDLKESRRALRFALKNVPRNHRLLLVHGNYESRIADTLTERPPIEEIRSNFLRLCKEEGRACEFKSFDYRSNRDFGEKVCSLARRQGAKSVIIGKRDDVSDTRRAIIGSSSQSVLSSCGLPVTVVQSEAHSSSWM